MNQAEVRGKKIQDGDYVVVDGNDRVPRQDEIILSIIDGGRQYKTLLFW